jgi:hypothetical protein
MPLLPEQNNFADLREEANTLQKTSKTDDVKRLAGMVAALAERCDKLEREVERHERLAKK